MRPALAILKYVPAVLCGLLVVAWVVSMRGHWVLMISGAGKALQLSAVSGTCTITGPVNAAENGPMFNAFRAIARRAEFNCAALGSFCLILGRPNILSIPIPFLLSLLFPLSLGPLIRFRFPLWSWFAWTALIAAELAYYCGNGGLFQIGGTAFTLS